MVTTNRIRRSRTFDHALLADARAALELWEREGGFGPTSSLTGSGAIDAFESKFASVCGARYALGLPSGTLALRTALAAAGVEHGASVVVPGFDWPAAAAAVKSLGARTVPADVRPGSFLLDPDAVSRCIDRSTRAVVVTHLAGVPADVRELQEICGRAEIPLIEDCCQALGAKTDKGPVGTFGAAAVFSIGPGKLIDAGEGGVLVTDDDEIYREAVRLTQHPTRQLRSGAVPNAFALTARLHPLSAILGFAALQGIVAELDERRKTAEMVVESAACLLGVEIPSERPGEQFSWPYVPAMVADEGMRALACGGVMIEPLGGYDIAALVGSHAPLPNARAAVRCGYRLHGTTSSQGKGTR
jgi:dTDP-4-amino-4,6-dideoxygalactose transaminase